jgi:hypothetical protein
MIKGAVSGAMKETVGQTVELAVSFRPQFSRCRYNSNQTIVTCLQTTRTNFVTEMDAMTRAELALPL